jgi:phospholipase D3/4
VNEHRERKKERKMGSSFCCSWRRRRRRRRSNKSMMMMMVSMQLLLLQSLVCLSAAKQTGEQIAPPSSASCQAWLVQSIPTDMPELPAVPGVLRTGDVLQWLAGNSSKSLDITSYYWELLALPKNPASGDYGYSQQQLDQFGAPVGQAVYDSLIAAADRGVPIR